MERGLQARASLYTGCLQARADLDRLGVPVAERLADVARHL